MELPILANQGGPSPTAGPVARAYDDDMAAHPTFVAAFARELACPGCGRQGLLPLDAHMAECPACGANLEVADVLCPDCGRINAADRTVCISCNAGLWRSCPNCGTRNWSGAPTCPRCARHVDALEHMLDRHVDVHVRQAARTDELVYGKQLDSEAARRAMDEMQAIEDRRVAQIQADERRALSENRRLVVGGLLITALFSTAAVGLSAFLLFAH